ncbi:MAG: chemotaxis protein CheW [Planctomycetota bacterium]
MNESNHPHSPGEFLADAPPEPMPGEPLEPGDVQGAVLEPAHDGLADPLARADVGESEPRAYGTFFVGSTEFAFPTGAVREVVPYPERVTPVPMCTDAVHGIFSLRGEVLPILDMAALLDLESTVERQDQRVAVIEIGASIVGVAIDRTGEVVRPLREEVHRMDHRKADSSEIIDGVIELAADERFIQTLSSDVLGALPGVPRHAEAAGRAETIAEAKSFSKAIVFRIGDVELALRIEDVLEIQSELEVSDAPAYFEHCAGVVLLRGHTYPILDLRAVFGSSAAEPARRYVFVGRGSDRVGLAVDALVETVEYPDEALLDVPQIASNDLVSVCRNVLEPEPARHVLVMSVEDLFEKVGVAGLADLLGYESEEQDAVEDDGAELGFFAFCVGGHTLCLSLDEVREVREIGGEVFSAGSGGGELDGLMNLRGRVLPLIDAKRRLGLDAEEAPGLRADPRTGAPGAEASVPQVESCDVALVVEVGDRAFGLVVDEIVDIKRTSAASVTEAGGAHGAGASAATGVMGFVRSTLLVQGRDGQGEMLVVLDAERLPVAS